LKPVRNIRRGTTGTALTTEGGYLIIKHYGKKVGVSVDWFGPHSARETAATNALDAGADTAKVREWLGHAHVSTTRVYDHRKTRPEDWSTFRVKYQSMSGINFSRSLCHLSSAATALLRPPAFVHDMHDPVMCFPKSRMLGRHRCRAKANRDVAQGNEVNYSQKYTNSKPCEP
jgi:hypothetical protein